ncbi:MAG: 50S ribosomal protein L30e [Candidatus Aenigmatarchaeota archaeon]
MKLEEEIIDANKAGKIVLGYKESKKFLRVNDAKLVVIAKNAPEKIRKEIEHNAKIAGVKIEVFNGSSKELGVLCGKPYPVSVLVIK